MRIRVLLFLIGLSTMVCGQSSYTWSGGGGDNNMSTSANWGGSTPGGAEYINFAGATRTNPTNDLSATNRFQLWFNSGADPFTVDGSTTNTFYDYSSSRPKIENSSTNNQTVNFPFVIGYSGGMEINPVSGDLTFGGAITNGGYQIFIYGNNGHDLYFNGGLSGTGAVQVAQNSTVHIQSACSYSGDTYLDGNGDMVIGSGGSLGSSNVRISSGSTFTVNSSVSVPSISERGTSNGGTISIASGQTLTINGSSVGTFYQNSISGDGGLTMAGSGTTTMALYGSQTFTGPVSISGGTITSGVALSSTSFTISGGELDLTAADLISNSANMTLSSGGTLSFGADETINNLTLNGGTLDIAAGQTLTINGTLRIESSTTINLNSTGSIAFGTGATLEYAQGSSVTTTNDEWPSTNGPDNLTISNGSTVSLHDARSLSGTLTLTSGTISLGTNNLTIGSAGDISGAPSWGSTTSSYIIAEGSGRLSRTVTTSATLFPIGTSGAYMPVRLTQASGSASYAVNLATPSGLTDDTYALDKVWDISGSGTIDMDMQWPDASEGSNFPTTGITFLKYNGSTWSDLSQSGSRSGGDPYTLSFTSVSCCSQFVPGGSQALPVELIRFEGVRLSPSTVQLIWTTASEINNDRFIVERSEDQRTFDPIGIVQGKGTSLEQNTYLFTDWETPSGTVYYQLRQIDFNGDEEVHPVISVSDEQRDINRFHVSPNPVQDQLTIHVNTGDEESGNLRITDFTGRVVYYSDLTFEQSTYVGTIDLSQWTSGTYFIEFTTSTGSEVVRVIK